MDSMVTIDLNRLTARIPVNLLMGYLNSLVTALAGLATVPAYVSAIGVEHYGVVAFFLTCKTVMMAMDMGMTQTVMRETAACLPNSEFGVLRTLFVGFERITWCVACLCLLVFTFSSQPIADNWIQTGVKTSESLSWNLFLMGIALAARWPSGLYQGVLIGAGRMIISSALSISAIVIADIGILVFWAFYEPSIESFFAWQAFVGLVYTLVTRGVAFQVLGKTSAPTTKTARDFLLRGITRDLAIISAAGSLLSQFDRIVISRVLPLSDLAKYSMGVMFAAGLYMAVTPIFNVMFPRFTHLHVSQDNEQLQKDYSRYSRLLARLVFPGAMFCILGAESILKLWTQSEFVAEDASIVLSVVAVSFALHGVMTAPHALVLATGNTKAILGQYAVLIPIVLPFTVWCTYQYGIAGAALSQLVHFTLYLVIGSWYAHRLVLRGYLAEWLLTDIAPAVTVSACMGSVGFYIVSQIANSSFEKIAAGCVIAGVAALLTLALEQKVKHLWAFVKQLSFN